MAQDIETARQWLRENPTDPRAAKVRDSIRAAGGTIDEPDEHSGLGDVARTVEQAWLLDPLEAIGQMGENLPGVGGYLRQAGEAMPDWLQGHLAASRAAAERHPWARTGLAIANPAFLLAPELGVGRLIPALGTAARGAIAGGAAAVLQPEDDPNDPHFWRQKAQQAVVGSVTGGTLGRMAGAADATAAATSRAASQYAKDVNAANAANLQADAARTLAQRQDAADYGKRITDFLTATGKQTTAQAEHAKRLTEQATRASEAATKHVEDVTATAVESGRLQAQHASDLAQYAAEVERRKGLDARKNIEWYGRILEPLGLRDRLPAQPGSAALASIQKMIGDRLNAANRQFTLSLDAVLNNTLGGHFADTMVELSDDASRSQWRNLFNRRVSGPLQDPLRGGKLSGEDFAQYISTINREADRLARSARTSTNAANQYAMADALHAMTAELEGAAEGPFLARQDRMKAREAYARWSKLSEAAEPEKGGIASAQEMIQEWARRQGHARYNADVTGNPDKQFLEQWRVESVVPKPEKPTAPTLPKAPKAPKFEEPEKPPKAATETPKTPEPPKDRPEAKRPGVFPPEPKPPEEKPPTLLRRSLREIGPFGIGEILHRTTGIPWWWGYAGARMLRPTLETLSRSPGGRQAVEAATRRPATAGAAAGQVPDMTDTAADISSIIPGL